MADLATMMMGAAGAAAGAVNPNAWDVSKAYYDAGPDAWDISKTSYPDISFSVASQETDPTGGFFKPDGTKMYVLGANGDDVNEYNLSTPWLVSSASYVQNFSVSAQETEPTGLFFKPDGTKMYVLGDIGDDVNEYDLSTPWNISTASYLQNFSVSAQDTNPEDLFFEPDGTKMYILGRVGDAVNEYSLSTAWNISTASYVQNFSVATQETEPRGLFFKPDGTKMYVTGRSGDDVNEYTLSTAWDVSTASFVTSSTLDLSSVYPTNPEGIFFHPDGTSFYIFGEYFDGDVTFSRRVWQYYIGGFNVQPQESVPNGLFFKPDGTKLYITGSNGDDVNEYNLSTAWDVSSASYVQNFSVSAQELGPEDLFFKPDGTKMYILGSDGDEVNEYTLSSAWDISTASYVQTFSVSAQEITPHGLFFKPDGTKMYVLGQTGDDVNEYNLSTPWDISTASYLQVKSIQAQEASPTGLFFKPDGTKMYVCGAQGDDVNEYDLSTPWDVSSATFLQNTPFLTTNPEGLFWKDDGTQFWLINNTNDRIYSFKISET